MKKKAPTLTKKTRINCRKCTHFFVTWDKRYPYGCKINGFKGKEIPSVEVRRTTGSPCYLFTEQLKKQS